MESSGKPKKNSKPVKLWQDKLFGHGLSLDLDGGKLSVNCLALVKFLSSPQLLHCCLVRINLALIRFLSHIDP